MSEFEQALEAWRRGDKAGAIRLWQQLAEQGDARSQFNLGVILDEGQGVERDAALATRYYETRLFGTVRNLADEKCIAGRHPDGIFPGMERSFPFLPGRAEYAF
jgi:hypothetical protein